MIIIGLTGGSGSGKSTIGKLFCELGAYSIDADVVYHELLENSKSMNNELKKRFPQAIGPEGNIVRSELAKIVFSDKTALCDLNSISHKFVIEETERRMAQLYQQNAQYICIDAIALLESGLANHCDITVGVIAPRETRIARIMSRDSISHEAASARINAQQPDSFFIENCTYTINNGGTLESAKKQVHDIFNLITKGPDDTNE